MRGRVILGILFLIFGVGILLEQLDIFNFNDMLSTWWPLILVVIGLIQVGNSGHSSKVPGIFMILFGLIFLVKELFEVNIFTFIWPLLFIFIGIVFIFSNGYRYRRNEDSRDMVQSLSVFSGNKIQSNSNNFKGGNITAIFGGTRIDLRKVTLSDEGAHLDVMTVFGGATILIPETMQLEVSGTPIFGGWEDKTENIIEDETGFKLHVKCLPIFGGVEIRN